jgi:hypothetical protein
VRLGAVVVSLLVLAGGAAACSDQGSAGVTGQGVTDDAVKVGFIAVDIGALSNSLGFVNVEDGGYPTVSKGIQAVVDYVNANGGLGGRRMEATIKPYDATQDTPEYAESICKSFTQDVGVFAMIFDAQFQNNARPCYRASNVLMLDQTLVAHDTTELEQFAPYLWTVSNPELNAFLNTQLAVLRDAQWFSGSTGVGIVYPDTEVTRRASQAVVAPYLAGLGITNVKQYAIDSSNIGTLGASTTAAVTNATKDGVDRIVTVGGTRILAVMLAQPEVAQLNAKYSVSTYDSPAFFVDNPSTIVAERRSGMAGLGFQGGGDARLGSGNVPFPDPANPQETLCKQIIDGAGATPPKTDRENYRVVFQHCDAALLLKAAFDAMPKDQITAESFRDAVWGLGTSWRSALAYGSGWTSGSYTGAAVGRGMYWDDACQLPEREQGCFRYGTGDVPFAPAPVTTAVPGAEAAPGATNAPGTAPTQ